jgi:hypothetical protein
MNIEIEHRNPAKAVRMTRLHRPDSHIIEEAKSHGAVGFGVMAGRADSTKGIRNFTSGDRIDSSA